VSANKVYQSYRITGVVAGDDKIIRDWQLYLIVAILADLYFLHLMNFHLLFLMPLLFFYLI
jgi:hypothetical protein